MIGLVRERVFAHYFGIGIEADAFRAALRIPNMIRNLLGEGTLSASFIPVYAATLERGEREDARQLAGAVLSFLVVIGIVGCAIGVLAAPGLTRAIALGFDEQTHALATRLVRILFPMAGVFIIAAWSLGVLNTHRRFFITYAAPTLWNVAQIGTLVALGSLLVGADLVTALAWGALGGAVLHLLVQLPSAIRFAGGIAWSLDPRVPGLRRVLRAWIPVVAGAGVVQISSLVDLQLASLLGEGAVANLGYAQLIGILPVSLFGISVAAASLPELSRDATLTDVDRLRTRMAGGVRRVLFFIIPSATAFVVLGRHVVGFVLETGAFSSAQTAVVATVLAGIGVGLPATGLIRLMASGHYAQGDTRTPVRIAMLSVTVGAALAFALMQRFGVVGIVLGGSIGAYVNVGLNYLALHRKLGRVLAVAELRWVLTSAAAATVAAVAAVGLEQIVPPMATWLAAMVILGAFGGVYLSITRVLRHPDIRQRNRLE